MLDSFRAEFPSFSAALARVRLPAVAREPTFWAFLSGLGIATIVSGILTTALLAAPATIQDPARQWPFGATAHSIVTLASHIVAGAVLVRAGGMRALLVYVAYVLATVLASLPGIMLFCDRAGGTEGSCRVPLVYIAAGRAPEWIGVALGAVAARFLPSRGEGANPTMRGAGAYGLTTFILSFPLSFLSGSGFFDDPSSGALLFIVIFAVAGVVGGVVLADAPLSGAVLVALAVLGPSLGYATPLLRGGGLPGEALEFTLARWSSVISALAAAIAIVAARGYVRRRRGGTFF